MLLEIADGKFYGTSGYLIWAEYLYSRKYQQMVKTRLSLVESDFGEYLMILNSYIELYFNSRSLQYEQEKH